MAEPNLPDRDAVADRGEREPLDVERDLPTEQADYNDASVDNDPALQTPEPGDRIPSDDDSERHSD